MKTVIIGFLFIAVLPVVFINTSPVTFFAVLATIGYTVLMGSPVIGAGYLAVRYLRRAD